MPRFYSAVFVIILSWFCFSPTLFAKPQATCDEQTLAEVKNRFRGILEQRERDRHSVSTEEFRDASQEYVEVAQLCYEVLYGPSPAGMPIDHGAETGEGYGGGASLMDAGPQFVTVGRKWGLGTPFPGGDDVPGPAISGGEVTYSFMADGVSMSGDASATTNNIAIAAAEWCSDVWDGLLRKEVKAAFAAWEAVADIRFREVADNGLAFNASGASGMIRIGFHGFTDSILAHAYYPPPTLVSAAGDLHFNSAIPWRCDTEVFSAGEYDLGIVAMHEIGHSIGLRHESDEYASMNTPYDPSVDFLTADDIEGAESIYGSPQNDRTFFGYVGMGTSSPSAPLHVKRSDGSAEVFVENAAASAAVRTMFQLTNNGAPRFAVKNATSGVEWSFQQSGPGNFLISKEGTGGPEVQVYQGGRVRMGPAGAINFDLDPSGNLKIKGSLTANGSTFPDYVFEPDYDLMSLSNLRTYIQQEKRLPDIPSTEEVKKQGGHNMTELQLKLLEKIEELTLYLLEKDAEIQSLKDRLAKLETGISE